MSPKSYKVISIISVFIAMLLVVFGCLAPWLFTGTGCERLDFTNTGQIGDTIGGAMGPFIAMAGVFLTFVAFLMQVRANEIQREQLHKSFNMMQLEHKIESMHALQLLHIDIQNTIKDIEVRCKYIDEYCSVLDENPMAEVACKRPSFLAIKRYLGIDRNLLYKAVSDFINTDNKEVWYRNIYAALDYYSEGVEQLWNDVYTPNTKDIMSIKSHIPELYTKLIESVNELSSSHNEELIKKFNVQILSLRRQDGTLDISAFQKFLSDGVYSNLFFYVPDVYQMLQNGFTQIMSIGMNMSKEMKETVALFRGDVIYGKLQRFEEDLSQSLQSISDNKLMEEFEKKNL